MPVLFPNSRLSLVNYAGYYRNSGGCKTGGLRPVDFQTTMETTRNGQYAHPPTNCRFNFFPEDTPGEASWVLALRDGRRRLVM